MIINDNIVYPSIIDRFFSKIRIGSNDECWEWIASKEPGKYGGYGFFGFAGKTFRAHRFMWMLINGEIPDGMLICHHCDNPSCVNINHLFIGTYADNNVDMVKKKRHSNWERNAPKKLTVKDVLAIREIYSQKVLTQEIATRCFEKSKAMKSIPGFDGYYITQHGEVLSTRINPPQIMKKRFHHGSYRVNLFNNNGQKCTIGIHTLILMTYGNISTTTKSTLKNDKEIMALLTRKKISQAVIAKKFGVSGVLISKIIQEKLWFGVK